MGGFETFRVVNASAGSGKTHRLTELIVARVVAGNPVSTILATTFTKRAAGELTERIRQALISSGRIGDAQQLPDALIGTVNGVCGQLLTEFAIDAGLSPKFKVIAETQQNEIFRIATDAVLDRFAEKVEPVARRLSCNGAIMGFKSHDPDWRKLADSIASLARTNRITPERLSESRDRSLAMLNQALPMPSTDGRSRWIQLATSAITAIDDERRRIRIEESKPLLKYFDAVHGDLSKILQLSSGGTALGSVTWKEWGLLARVYGRGKQVESVIGSGLREVELTLLTSAEFQTDMRTLIGLIFDCSAEALSAFQHYKKSEGLIDFVDQETLLLQLLEESPQICSSVSERLGFVVVDEFQDTSPLQLELFVRLGALAKESVWVGDPKQAIFGFRGTDPVLMGKVADAIAANGSDAVSTLSHSWRSKETLVDFSNRLFVSIFNHLDPSAVQLTIPADKTEKASGGTVETWTLEATNKVDEAACVARQITTYLAENPDRRACDVAVLASTGADVLRVSDALNAMGVRTSPPDQAPLNNTEMRFVIAGISYLLDDHDTVALAELVTLLAEHPSTNSWLDEALAQQDAFATWKDEPAIRSLDDLRGRLMVLTPLEVVEEVVGRLDIIGRLVGWTHAATRRTNVDSLRAHVHSYYDTAESLNLSPSVSGFLRYLLALRQSEFQYDGSDVLTVLTYHKAKGLEWPVVVMTSLDQEARRRIDGVSVQSDGEFDPSHPLAGRWIQLWHDPLDTFAPWKDLQESLTEFDSAVAHEIASKSRVLYVGATRAADVLVLVARQPRTSASSVTPAWCNLRVPKVLQWTPGADHLMLAGEIFPATGRILTPLGTDSTSVRTPKAGFTDKPATLHRLNHRAKRFTASGLHGEAKNGVEPVVNEGAHSPGAATPVIHVELHSRLGDAVAQAAGADASELGNAVHGFLTLQSLSLGSPHATAVATRLLERHGADAYLKAPDLVTMAMRWRRFVATNFPDGQVLAEHPVVWNTKHHQRMEGWIDALIKTEAGYVVVDHKSFSGSDPRGKIESEFTGQLAAYVEAIMAATGEPIVGVYVHMPLRGEVYKVTSLFEQYR